LLNAGRHAATDDADRRHGHRLIPAHQRANTDHNPIAPAVRQVNAPAYYATRLLHAGPDDRTGLMPAIREVTR
ncbi:hypothetical protein, partial [Streptomyces xylophagus]|uniref:hypothetical protein n=1 Tax=Streptomyces xylophagus TaxID=285514 RepID=UPI0005B8DC2C